MVSTCSRANQSSCTIFLNVERFRWESPAALAPGKHTIVFDFKYEGPLGGTGVLSVDGKEVASRTIPHTIPSKRSTRPSMSVWTPALAWTTRTTSRHSVSPASIDKLTVKLVPMKAAEELHQHKSPGNDKQGTVSRSDLAAWHFAFTATQNCDSPRHLFCVIRRETCLSMFRLSDLKSTKASGASIAALVAGALGFAQNIRGSMQAPRPPKATIIQINSFT